MKKMKVGDIIINKITGQRFIVKKIIRDPEHELRGIPFAVEGNFISCGVSATLIFGIVSGTKNHTHSSWRNWSIKKSYRVPRTKPSELSVA